MADPRKLPPKKKTDMEAGEEPKDSNTVTTLRLLVLLQGAVGGISAASLADTTGLTTRTVRRHLTKLRRAGVRIEASPSKGYTLAGGFFVQPPDLTLEEAAALTLAGDSGALPAPLDRALREAVAKLRAALPIALGAPEPGVSAGVTVSPPPSEGDAAGDLYAIFERAVAGRTRLACAYEAPGKPEPEHFLLDPWSLHFSRRAWYVAGLHHGRGEAGEPRNLRVSRFTEAAPTTDVFQPPRGFSMRQHLGEAWRMIRGDEVFDVAVRFRPDFAETAEATLWHASQRASYEDDGSCVLRFRVAGLDEIVWWVLGYGPGCEVLEPVALRERVRELAEATAARYAETDASAG